MKKSIKVMQDRLLKFRESMRKNNFDAALVTKRKNYLYLSGFTGTSAYLVITMDNAYLLTDFRYIHQAAYEAPIFEVVRYQKDVVYAINNILMENRVGRLGFEESHLTFNTYTRFKEKLEVKDFSPLKGLIEYQRSVKDEEEISIISKAVEIADRAFEYIIDFIKPGVREMEIAVELEYFMRKKGASGVSFETIVASGERSAMPHGTASEKKVQMGDAVTIDFGAVYKGYCSDMTRTVFVGNPGEEMKKIYNIVLNSQLKALQNAAAGLKGKDIDAIARKYISDSGYGNNFGHGLGHGVGLEIHEKPTFSPYEENEILNNMVITVEPGIYVEGLGGVRIEDMIVIRDDNPEILTSSTKELIIL